MPFIATTTASVFRGQDVDQYGDEVDNNVLVMAGMPIAITTKSKTVVNDTSSNPQVVRWYTGRVVATQQLFTNDRIRDNRTGTTYVVDNVTYTSSLSQQTSCILDLRVVTGPTTA